MFTTSTTKNTRRLFPFGSLRFSEFSFAFCKEIFSVFYWAWVLLPSQGMEGTWMEENENTFVYKWTHIKAKSFWQFSVETLIQHAMAKKSFKEENLFIFIFLGLDCSFGHDKDFDGWPYIILPHIVSSHLTLTLISPTLMFPSRSGQFHFICYAYTA